MLHLSTNIPFFPTKWYCCLNIDSNHNSCDVSQEEEDRFSDNNASDNMLVDTDMEDEGNNKNILCFFKSCHQ